MYSSQTGMEARGRGATSCLPLIDYSLYSLYSLVRSIVHIKKFIVKMMTINKPIIKITIKNVIKHNTNARYLYRVGLA